MKNEKIKPLLKKLIIPTVLLVALLIIGGFAGLFRNLGSMITLSLENLVRAAVAVAFLVVLYYVLSIVLSFFSEKSGRVGTMATLISSISRYAAVLLGFCWVAGIIGVNVSTIFASVGILALIIGFGAESLVADLVTGVFILFENEYNVGDIIEVDGYRGTVKEIGIRTLSLEDGGGNVKIINNSSLKNIINRSNHNSAAVVDITVSYEMDLETMDKVIPELLAQIQENNKDVFKGIRYAGVESMNSSGMTLRVVADVEEKDIFSGRRLLNKELRIAFDKKGIHMPGAPVRAAK